MMAKQLVHVRLELFDDQLACRKYFIVNNQVFQSLIHTK